MTTAKPNPTCRKPDASASRQMILAVSLIAAMTALRIAYASLLDLRTDEAYYWTW